MYMWNTLKVTIFGHFIQHMETIKVKIILTHNAYEIRPRHACGLKEDTFTCPCLPKMLKTYLFGHLWKIWQQSHHQGFGITIIGQAG